MDWVERVKTALFGDGGIFGGCLCASKNKSPTADPVEAAAAVDFAGKQDGISRHRHRARADVRHDNLVRLLSYAITPDLRVLFFEFATVGTLHNVLHGPRGEPQPQPSRSSSRPAVTLRWAQRTRIALDAARGLHYLHEVVPMGQWGVRSTNVLLFEGLRAKIADYDVFEQPPMEELARDMCAEHPWARTCYLPPEYIQSGNRIAYKTDVYSFGVVLLELLTGRKLDYVTPDSRTLCNGVKRCIDPKLGTQSPPAGALKLGRIALQCLHHDCRSRPSMGAVAEMISGIVTE